MGEAATHRPAARIQPAPSCPAVRGPDAGRRCAEGKGAGPGRGPRVPAGQQDTEREPCGHLPSDMAAAPTLTTTHAALTAGADRTLPSPPATCPLGPSPPRKAPVGRGAEVTSRPSSVTDPSMHVHRPMSASRGRAAPPSFTEGVKNPHEANKRQNEQKMRIAVSQAANGCVERCCTARATGGNAD